MANGIGAEDHELNDQQTGAAEGSGHHLGEQRHDVSPAHQEARTDVDVDGGTGVGRDEGGDNRAREHEAESAEPAARFIEQELWKTEIGMVTQSNTKPVIDRCTVEEYPEGFPQAAAFINADPTFAIYRRFSRGRTRIILQLQAQLMMLEKKLDQYDKEMAEDKDAKGILHQSGFPKLSGSAPAIRVLQKKRTRCYEEFNEVLRRYDDVVIRDFTLRRLPSPSLHARKNVGRYFYQEQPFVKGENDHMTYVEDLIAVGKGEKDSWLEGSISSSLKSQPWRVLKVH